MYKYSLCKLCIKNHAGRTVPELQNIKEDMQPRVSPKIDYYSKILAISLTEKGPKNAD